MIVKTDSNSLPFLYANSFNIIEIVFIAIGIALVTRLFIKGVFEDCQYIQEDAKLNTDKKQKQFKLSEEERLKLLTEINTKLNSSLSYTNKTDCKAKEFRINYTYNYKKKKGTNSKRVIFAEKMEDIRFIF